MGEYMGVNTDDPDIKSVVKDMTKSGQTMEKMMRVVGMPYEVIDTHREEAKREMAKKKKKKKPGY